MIPATNTDDAQARTRSYESGVRGGAHHRPRRLPILAALVLVSLLSWVAGAQVGSREEDVLTGDAPPESSLTEPVQFRVLEREVSLRGTIVPAVETAVYGSASEGQLAVITAASRPIGSEVEEGTPAFGLNGRPVFLLEGSIPTYRDMGPGDSGPDVRQLQDALVRLGSLEAVDADGVFGRRTQEGVANLYRREGYEVLMTDAAALDALASADEEVARAKAALQDMQADSVQSPTDAIAVLEAQAEVDKAVDDAAVVEVAATVAKAEAEAEVAAAEAAAAEAEQSGSELSQVAADAALLAARGQLEIVAATWDATRADGGRAIVLAQAKLDAAQNPKDNDARNAAVRELEHALSEAQRAKRTAESTHGMWLPRSEIVFVPQLPASVVWSAAVIGASVEANQPVLKLATGGLEVSAEVPLEEAREISVGNRGDAAFMDPVGPQKVEVVDIAEHVTPEGVTSSRVRLRFLDGDPPSAGLGANGEIGFVIERSEGRVLAVPISALFAREDGDVYLRLSVDGIFTPVRVREGMHAGGLVEVKSIDGATIREGDEVLVGT